MPKLVGMNHVALEVGDIDEALAFWESIFGELELRGRGKQMADKKELMHVRHFLERSTMAGAKMSGGSR